MCDKSKKKCQNVSQQVFLRQNQIQPGAKNSFFGDLLLRSRFRQQTFHQRNIKGHFGCINAIEFSSENQNLLASGGDDKSIVLWRVGQLLTKSQPKCLSKMEAQHLSNIFALAFDSEAKQILSSGNDHQVILHDVSTTKPKDVWLLDNAVYSLSVNPINDQVFCTASEDGKVKIWDTRLKEEAIVLAETRQAFQSAFYNPTEPLLVASAHVKSGVQLWDVRKPKECLIQYGGHLTSFDSSASQSTMSVRWDEQGKRLFALRRRMMPVLYELGIPHPVATFDHPGYYNSCTMKSCCFGGPDDSYVMSGSDDWALYIWKTPPLNGSRNNLRTKTIRHASLVLKGHQSIVNQVRYSRQNHVIASSGVEKIIKLWSPWAFGSESNTEQSDDNINIRPLFTHEEYLNMNLRGDLPSLFDVHDNNNQDEEDVRMLAFFDSLVQREIDGWSDELPTDDDDSSDENDEVTETSSHHSYSLEVVPSSSSSSSSSSESDENEEKKEKSPVSSVDRTKRNTERDAFSEADASDADDSGLRVGLRLDGPLTVITGLFGRVTQEETRSNRSNTQLNAPERNVTQLVIRKRQQMALQASKRARKRGRFQSESDAVELVKSNLSSTEVEKRVSMARKHMSLRQKRLRLIRRQTMFMDVLSQITDSEEESSEEEPEPTVYPVIQSTNGHVTELQESTSTSGLVQLPEPLRTDTCEEIPSEIKTAIRDLTENVTNQSDGFKKITKKPENPKYRDRNDDSE